MDLLLYCGVLFATLLILRLMSKHINITAPRNWPIVGMLPSMLANYNSIYEWAGELAGPVMAAGGAMLVKSPIFCGSDKLFTVSPANVQYTSSTRFSDYIRGQNSKELFDVLGESALNSEPPEWNLHRKYLRHALSHKRFAEVSTTLSHEKVEKALVPVLDDVVKRGDGVVDFQSLFERYMFDLTLQLGVGVDPESLSTDSPEIHFSHALNDAMDGVFFRHFLPEKLWKLQRLLGVGKEKTLKEARKVMHEFAAKHIKIIEEEYKNGREQGHGTEIMKPYIVDREQFKSESDSFLSDILLGYMLAGKDTTSSALTWFFWLVTTHPSVERKLREELKQVLPEEKRESWHLHTPEELSKLAYLHAALNETLRLYPPIPFLTRSPLEHDTLPTGHRIAPGTMMVLSIYTMGRTPEIWGEDCNEFKPERWITEKGELKHEPSHKFFTFNCGPRICLGKELAYTQMRAVASAILHNYDLKVVEGQNPSPKSSVILQMKNGLHVRVTKRTKQYHGC